MTGKGPKSDSATSITFNENSDVDMWTRSESIYRRMKKAGYFPKHEDAESAQFVFPLSEFRLPRKPSPKRVEQGKRIGKMRAEKKQGEPTPPVCLHLKQE